MKGAHQALLSRIDGPINHASLSKSTFVNFSPLCSFSFKFLSSFARQLFLSIISCLWSPSTSPGCLRELEGLGRTMQFRSSASSLLLLHLYLLGRALEVKGQERGYLQEALGALDLPLGADTQPQLHKSNIGVLLAALLQAVCCPERTGASEDVCDRVRSAPVLCSHTQ